MYDTADTERRMMLESHRRADEHDDDPRSILEFKRNKVVEGRVVRVP